MNENPGEMPNPLNPTPAASPEPNNPAPAAPSAEPAPAPAPVPATKPAVGTPDPMARPMEQAPVAEPIAEPKKKKTGLIVGIIIAAVLLIGGIVAAVLLLVGKSGDPVSAAMEKIMSGNIPQYTTVNGSIDVAIGSSELPISGLKIALDSNSATNSLINTTTANVTASLTNGTDIEIELSEIYATNGDLYIKVDKLADAINDATASLYEGVDEDMIAEALSSVNNIVKMVDGKWLKISVDELTQMTSGAATDSSTKCLTDLVSGINNNNNALAEAYRKSPFVSSTTEGVSVASKNSTVYKVVLDQTAFTTFTNDAANSSLFQELYECTGTTKQEVTEEDVAELFSQLPTLYVEIDGENNFSRLFFTGDVGDDVALTVDLGMTYPATINVAEPTESEPLMTVIQKIMTRVYSLSGDF